MANLHVREISGRTYGKSRWSARAHYKIAARKLRRVRAVRESLAARGNGYVD